ncbi:unnamed protein product [Spirodela intermedia]|uniref:Uncharacterized protein n=1 Tax=Spirodela intermedia TaxID=51605 RepID=A0A7I8LBV3_SPIIN|nr:unnamed protein product [Spirodela intermedia]
MLTVAFRTMVKLMSVAGTLGSDLQLEAPAQRLAQWHHLGKSLAAVHNLRVLAQAFQAWCAIIALQHLQGAAPTGLRC